MTDTRSQSSASIVEQLRERANDTFIRDHAQGVLIEAHPLLAEAADEIERLRGQVETLRELRKYDTAEIERLRDIHFQAEDLLNTQAAEIERLRAISPAG